MVDDHHIAVTGAISKLAKTQFLCSESICKIWCSKLVYIGLKCDLFGT